MFADALRRQGLPISKEDHQGGAAEAPHEAEIATKKGDPSDERGPQADRASRSFRSRMKRKRGHAKANAITKVSAM